MRLSRHDLEKLDGRLDAANARTFRLIRAVLKTRAARTRSLQSIVFQGALGTVVALATAMDPAVALVMAMAMATTTGVANGLQTAKALRP
jgi:hypothetical protein